MGRFVAGTSCIAGFAQPAAGHGMEHVAHGDRKVRETNRLCWSCPANVGTRLYKVPFLCTSCMGRAQDLLQCKVLAKNGSSFYGSRDLKTTQYALSEAACHECFLRHNSILHYFIDAKKDKNDAASEDDSP
ncbi:unnamed protein product, partial [Mesorhabditis spiculigera]